MRSPGNGELNMPNAFARLEGKTTAAAYTPEEEPHGADPANGTETTHVAQRSYRPPLFRPSGDRTRGEHLHGEPSREPTPSKPARHP